MSNARKPKGTPTRLNVHVLDNYFAGRDRAPADRVPATDEPHLRRCLKAGLMTVEGRELVLTDAGREAIAGQP